MSAHHGEIDPVATAARRLLDGVGLATVAVRGSKSRSDVMTAVEHRWVGNETIVVTGMPAPWSELIVQPGRDVDVVVMIDEYAPIIEAKVHVGSLHGYGAARSVKHGEGWMVEIEIQLGDMTVRRLGSEGTVRAKDLRGIPADPLSRDATGLVDAIWAHFGGDLATLAGSQDAAQPPYVLGVDAGGLHLLTELGEGADVVHLPFLTRAESVTDVVREMGHYVARAS